MSVTHITARFLECLDLLVAEGRVRSKRHFALSVGYHPQGISEMSANRRDAPLELIEKAVNLFRFSPSYLFTGLGEPFTNPIGENDLNLKNLTIVTDQHGEERIVHVPYKAQAGYGQYLDDPVFIGDLPNYQLPDPQFRSGTYRSFEIAGDSMEPTFRPNDIVISAFIEPRYWEQAIKNGQVYVVVTLKDVFLKRVANQIKSEKVVECHSDNPVYDPFSIPVKEIREVWKARIRLTSHLDSPVQRINPNEISEQLQAQQRMLENLQHYFTSAKTTS